MRYPAGVKDFSLILVLISNFFFQAVRPGGNYLGQYCSLLALVHILYMFIYFISECYAVHHITYIKITLHVNDMDIHGYCYS